MTAVIGAALAAAGSPALAASNATDFGIRPVGMKIVSTPAANQASSAVMAPGTPLNLSAVAALGSHWGRVTSTRRSPAHNRAVGGVPNSYHLSGRAIDIARRPGVRHADIAAAFRAAGYRLIESLDEGDHSHFAFATGGAVPRPVLEARAGGSSGSVTRWGIVTVASANRR